MNSTSSPSDMNAVPYWVGVCVLVGFVLLPGFLLFTLPSPTVVATQTALTSTAIAANWTPVPTVTRFPAESEIQKKEAAIIQIFPTITPMVIPTPTIFSTQTTFSDADSVKFSVIGSYGWEQPEADDLARMIQNWEPDFITTTGNNTMYNGDPSLIDKNIGQYYHSYISPYYGNFGKGADQNRFFPALGMYDYSSNIEESPFLSYFTLPGNEHYYDVVWGPVHLIVLNTVPIGEDGLGSATAQGIWLKSTLLYSDSPWKIVVMYDSPYSSGMNGSNESMQLPFKEWGASAVISGRDQTYERIMVDGFPYFNNGLGIRQAAFGNPIPGSEVRYNENNGAMFVTATNTTITFEFVDLFQKTVDTFTLEKEK